MIESLALFHGSSFGSGCGARVAYFFDSGGSKFDLESQSARLYIASNVHALRGISGSVPGRAFVGSRWTIQRLKGACGKLPIFRKRHQTEHRPERDGGGRLPLCGAHLG